jgi:hypothetical protein
MFNFNDYRLHNQAKSPVPVGNRRIISSPRGAQGGRKEGYDGFVSRKTFCACRKLPTPVLQNYGEAEQGTSNGSHGSGRLIRSHEEILNVGGGPRSTGHPLTVDGMVSNPCVGHIRPRPENSRSVTVCLGSKLVVAASPTSYPRFTHNC